MGTIEHAELWMGQMTEYSTRILRAIEEAQINNPSSSESDPPRQVLVDGCPVHVLRKIHPIDGSQSLIGGIDITRCGDLGELVRDADGKITIDFDPTRKLEEERKNLKRPVGDKDIIWVFGGKSKPSHCCLGHLGPSPNCWRIIHPCC